MAVTYLLYSIALTLADNNNPGSRMLDTSIIITHEVI